MKTTTTAKASPYIEVLIQDESGLDWVKIYPAKA